MTGVGQSRYAARLTVTCLLCLSLLSACTSPPPVSASREALWQRFGNQPLDTLLMSWGTPAGETHLTNGARLVTYRHGTVYDNASPYERVSDCQVSFLAPPPRFVIDNISMQGDPYECLLLAQGQTGYRRFPYVPPPYPPFPYAWRRF